MSGLNGVDGVLAAIGDAAFWENLLTVFVKYGKNLLIAAAILIVGRLIAKKLKTLLAQAMEKSKTDPMLISFITSMAYVLVMVFLVITALGVLGIPTASFVVVLGSAGLAIGLALQGALANFAAGVLMLIFKPFKVGDVIEGAGVLGVVDHVEIFNTVLRTPDNRSIIVPNAKMLGDNLINYTVTGTRRVDLVAGVGYSDDLSKVRTVLDGILKSDDRILPDPEPKIGVVELADSSVNFAVRPWVKTEDYWDVYFDITEQIKLRFDEEGINIPFPQRDVHVYTEK